MLVHAFTRSEETPINLYGITVLFKPNATGHVVAEVSDERAMARLLSITEAFREFTGADVHAQPVARVAAPVASQAPAPEPDPVAEVVTGHSSAEFPVSIEIVAAALARSELNVEEWNLNDEEDRDALIEAEVELMRQVEVAAAAAAAVDADAEAADPLVLKADDGTTIDLGAMSAKDVRAFATQNGVTLPGGNSTKVADLRLMVAQALTKA